MGRAEANGLSRHVARVLLRQPLRGAQHDLRRASGPCAAGAQRQAERRAEHRHHYHGQARTCGPAGLAAMAEGTPVGRLVGHAATVSEDRAEREIHAISENIEISAPSEESAT
jgi:hypothetical protein